MVFLNSGLKSLLKFSSFYKLAYCLFLTKSNGYLEFTPEIFKHGVLNLFELGDTNIFTNQLIILFK